MALNMHKEELDSIINEYISEIKKILGADLKRAVIYGSYARGEYEEESDIDIALFTSSKFFSVSVIFQPSLIPIFHLH